MKALEVVYDHFVSTMTHASTCWSSNMSGRAVHLCSDKPQTFHSPTLKVWLGCGSAGLGIIGVVCCKEDHRGAAWFVLDGWGGGLF